MQVSKGIEGQQDPILILLILLIPYPIKVVVATAATCWGMTSVAHLVVVMGTQFFDASGSGSSDYPVTDLLQMMGRASRPNIDDSGVWM